MHSNTDETVSPWMEALPGSGPKLKSNLNADTVVIGAGIAGMTTAYLLAREGQDVVVVEAGVPGGGMTARTTGHLVTAIDGRWYNLIARRGLKKALLAAASQVAAIDFIDRTQSVEGIACDFARVDGFLISSTTDKAQTLQRELKAAAHLGLDGVGWADAGPFPGLDVSPCLRFPGQGRLHAVKYVRGLAEAFARHGGRLVSARVDGVKGGKKAVVTAGARKIEAGSVVVATNSPINGKTVHRKQTPYRTYVLAAYAPKGSIPDALGWDTGEPYHYTRIQPIDETRDLLIVGGEDHKTGEADDMDRRLLRLKEWTRLRFPSAGEIAFRWSGQVMETIDDLGHNGRNAGDKDNVFIVTGDSGLGLTNGTIAGLVISDRIMGRKNPWGPIYDPARGKPKNLDPHMRPSAKAEPVKKPATPPSIAPGTGAIVSHGARTFAIYRQPKGRLVTLSAKCTHAGCPVAWNQFERCWDCRCHGSHFAAEGDVTHAPAAENLAKAKVPAALLKR